MTPPTNVKIGPESSSTRAIESSSTIMVMRVHESEEKGKVEQVQEGQSEGKGERGH